MMQFYPDALGGRASAAAGTTPPAGGGLQTLLNSLMGGANTQTGVAPGQGNSPGSIPGYQTGDEAYYTKPAPVGSLPNQVQPYKGGSITDFFKSIGLLPTDDSQAVGQAPTDGKVLTTNNDPSPVPNSNNTSSTSTLQYDIQQGIVPQGAGSIQAMLSALASLQSQGSGTSPTTPAAPTSDAPAPGTQPAPNTPATPQGLTQFQPNGSGQDNQWADPSIASPLASLSHYLNGISWYGGQSSNDAGGNSGIQNEIYSTGAYDKNVTPEDDANASLQAALATAQKYDPNARIDYYDPTSGSEGGGSSPMARIVMDQSKLPPAPDFSKYGGAQLLSNVRTANNQSPDAGQGVHLFDQSAVYMDPNWGPLTFRQNVKPEQDKFTDVGTWGPLAVAALTGGAGLLGGFATSGGLGAAGAFRSIGGGLMNGQDVTGGILGMLANLSGIPGAGTLANLAYTAARGGGINISSIIPLLGRLAMSGGPGGGGG